MKNSKLRCSFTLIEILVVITVIVILVAIAMPFLSRMREHANATKCRGNLRQLYYAALSYANDGGGGLPNAYAWEYHQPPDDDDEDGIDKYWEVKGWVNWLQYPAYPSGQSYHTASQSGNAHRPKWWGSTPDIPANNASANAYTSITNGTLWKHTGKRIGIYLCPTFQRDDVCAPNGTMPDGSTTIDPVRSYAMNRSMNNRNILDMTDGSRRLLFSEVRTAAGGGCASRGFLQNSEWAYDADLYTSNSTGPEAIGEFHSGGRGNVVFADGHIDFTFGSNTYKMCSGQLYDE